MECVDVCGDQALVTATQTPEAVQQMQTRWHTWLALPSTPPEFIRIDDLNEKIGALDTLFTGASFGDDNIPFVTVEPVEGNRERRLTDAGGNSLPTLSLRLAFGNGIQQSARRGAVDEVLVESAVRAITADLVARVRDLLDTARLPVEDGGSQTKRVRPSDIAVLVSTAAQGNEVQRALLRQGVPAVISGGDSVLQSPAAQQMRFLLYAMDRPTDLRRARTFALSWFVGWSAEELAHASEKELDSRQEQLRAWSDMLADHSVAEVLARVWTFVSSQVTRKLMPTPMAPPLALLRRDP